MRGIAPSSITPLLHAFLDNVWNAHKISTASADETPYVGRIEGEDVVDLTQDSGEPLPEGCPPMPLDWEPSGITMTLTEGNFTATRTFDTNVNGPEDVNGAYLEMRAEIWMKMWQAKYVPHDMVADPDTGVVHCADCHAPDWQVKAGVSCTKQVQRTAAEA